MFRSTFPASALCAGAALLSLGAASAQSFDVYASLTSDDTIGSETVRDQDILIHSDGSVARTVLPSESLALWADNNELGDIDALHDAGAGGMASDSLYISLLSNELGFEDGDILRFVDGELVVFIPEDAFNVVTGVDGDLDVDAFQLEPDGTIYFSLAENEVSNTLQGDVPGTIEDGDILEWIGGSAAATIVFTESQVTAMVNAALGNATASGDTKSLARDPDTGALLFTVQSPSSDDGTVISSFNGGELIGAHEEADFGFAGGGEIDALTVAATTFPTLMIETPLVTAGDDVTVRVEGAEPNSAYVLLAATDITSNIIMPLNGWGGLALLNDAVLGSMLMSAPYLIIATDAFGEGEFTIAVAPAIGATDWALQAIAPGPFLTSTNPLLLRVEQ